MRVPRTTQDASYSYAAVDGLRGVAALLVLSYHLTLATGLAVAPLAAELKAGVTVFFVISGFLLYLPYARAIRGGEPLPAWRSYAERRAVRILPAYWVALTILALGPLSSSVATAHWYTYYGLTQIYNPDTLLSGLGVAWSLCVEVTFYLLLPLLANVVARLCAGRHGRRATHIQLQVVVVLAAASIAVRELATSSLTAPGGGDHAVLLSSLPGLLDWFAVGMVLGVLACEWEAGHGFARILERLRSHAGTCWLIAVGLYVLASPFQHGDQFLPLYGVTTHVLLGVACGFLILPLTGRGRLAFPARLLARPLARWLGAISYGIYLWHVSLLQALQKALSIPTHRASPLQVLLLAAVVVAGAVSAGALSRYLVECPAQRLARRRRLRLAGATAVAAA